MTLYTYVAIIILLKRQIVSNCVVFLSKIRGQFIAAAKMLCMAFDAESM